MKYIAIHHTAVSREKNQYQASAVNRYHKDKWSMKSKLGWFIGYNFFCEPNGVRFNTREIGEETMANKGHNCDIASRCDTISYCFTGNFNNELPTDAQIEDFREFVEEMREDYPKIKVVFHRDIQTGRTCPGKLFTQDYLETAVLKKKEIKSDKVDKEKEINIEEAAAALSKNKLWELIKKLFTLYLAK